MQVMYSELNGCSYELPMPAPGEHVLPEVAWGRFDQFFTPAFWRAQAWQHQILGTYSGIRFGQNLREEAAACLLGGFGMPAELGVAAFHRLNRASMLVSGTSFEAILSVLSEPLVVRGRRRQYRFARQKARYLALALTAIDEISPSLDDVALRDELATLPGIGLKTASWIVRNHRFSTSVAVLDIHVLRAIDWMGLYRVDAFRTAQYRVVEGLYLSLVEALETPAWLLDAVIWDYMRVLWRVVDLDASTNQRNDAQAKFDL